MSELSSIAKVAPVPGEAVDFAVLPDPSEQFGAEDIQKIADRIARKGDVIDNLPWLRRISWIGATSLVCAGIAGSYEVTFHLLSNQETPDVQFALLAAAAVPVTVAQKLQRQKLRHKYKGVVESFEALQKDKELSVELYRASPKRKKQGLDLRWYATDEPIPAATLATKLKGLAEIAEAGSIPMITIPADQIADYVDETVLERATSHDDWLKKRKKLGIKDKILGEQPVVTLSLEELDQTLQRVETAQTGEPLNTLMRILVLVQPNHPALKYYDSNPASPRRFQFERSLRMAIERRLDAVEQSKVMIDDVPIRQKVHLMGTPRIGKNGQVLGDYRALNNKLHGQTVDLLRELKIDEDGLASILKNWDKYPPQKVIELCELASWLTLKGQIPELHTEAGQEPMPGDNAEDKLPPSALALQERLGREVLKLRKRRERSHNFIPGDAFLVKRYTFSLAALMMSFYGGMVAGSHMEGTYDRLTLEANGPSGTTYNPNYDKDLEHLVHANPVAKIYEEHSHVGNWAYHQYYEARDNILTWAGFTPSSAEKQSQSLTDARSALNESLDRFLGEAGVGNVPEAGNRPLWYVKEFGGVATEGYWSEERFDGLLQNQATISWDQVTRDEAQHVEYIESTDSADPNRPHILVEGNLPSNIARFASFNCLLIDNNQIREDDLCGFNLTIPVRNGTRITAAKLSGTTGLVTVTMSGGNQVLHVPSNAIKDGRELDKPRLEYWLEPSQGASVHAAGPSKYIDGGKSVDWPAQTINKAWSDYLKQPLPGDPNARLQAEAAAITKNFNYELAPLPESTEHTITDAASYVAGVLALQAANCNVANTLLAVSNPDELNFVTGFYNTNTQEQVDYGQLYLSSAEAHAWTVDKSGDIHDATPSKGAENFGDHFAENFGNRNIDTDPTAERQQRFARYALFGGATITAAALLAKRKKIAAVPTAVRRKTSGFYLRRVSDARLNHAYGALTHKLWAVDGSPLPARAEKMSPDNVFEGLESYAHNGQLRNTLQQLSSASHKTEDRFYRRNLRRAKRLLKAIHYQG